jgi:hypothetical protein
VDAPVKQPEFEGLHLLFIHNLRRSRESTAGVSSRGTGMSRRSSSSVRLWLLTTLFGLGALLPAAAVQNSSAVEQHLLREDAPALAASQTAVLPERESLLPANVRHSSHALPRTSTPTLPLRTAWLPTPEFATSAPAPEHTRAIAQTPRTTGPSRAPPAA